MKVEYKKDLRHNYMIITDDANGEIDLYGIRMMEHQEIDGILHVEQRRMDNNLLLYYDITARQSMSAIFDKTTFSKDKVKQLCCGIINTIERAYEFLLPEEDFILEPDFIYTDIVSNEPSLCFLPGYGKGIKNQMSSLMEYLMNKVDYNDREAVLLVYRLYAVSREEGYTFDHLIKVLQESAQVIEDKKGVYNKDDLENKKGVYDKEDLANKRGVYNKEDLEDKKGIFDKEDIENEKGRKSEKFIEEKKIIQHNKAGDNLKLLREEQFSERPDHQKISKANEYQNKVGSFDKEGSIRLRKKIHDKSDFIQSKTPVMMEKIEGEEEVTCYPAATYLYTGACIVAGILLIILSIVTKILYNTYGNRIDFIKLAAFLLIAFCVEGYLLKRIWDKTNQITRIVTKNEYIDPRQFNNSTETKSLSKRKFPENNITGRNYDNENIENKSIELSPNTEMNQIINGNKLSDRNRVILLNDSEYSEVKYDELEVDNPTCLLNTQEQNTANATSSDIVSKYVLNALDSVNYQAISITNFPFFIGKLKKNVDYCLKNDAVSRYHAKITKEEEEHYYITDLNSTNGTFINDSALQTYEKREINIGDEIAFANIAFRFEQTYS